MRPQPHRHGRIKGLECKFTFGSIAYCTRMGWVADESVVFLTAYQAKGHSVFRQSAESPPAAHFPSRKKLCIYNHHPLFALLILNYPFPRRQLNGRVWQGDEAWASTRPRNEWQLLRRGGTSSLSRSAELLRSFENKVGSSLSDEDSHLRPVSAALASSDETASQQQRAVLSEGERDWGRVRGRHPLSREEKHHGTPSVSSRSSLASKHNRPGSSSWVHRRSLPSLLVNRTMEPPTWRQRAKAAPKPPSEPSGGATVRKRGKRRPSLDEPSGIMQRLDIMSTAVTVGDAFSRSGGASRGVWGNPSWNSSETKVVPAGSFGEGRPAGAVTPLEVELKNGLDGKAGSPGRTRRGIASSGKLLSSAIPKPLLYVGSGGGFRLTSYA